MPVATRTRVVVLRHALEAFRSTNTGRIALLALENAALVRAVGQIELVFTFIASHVVLKERPSAGEWLGSVLVIGGVVLILLGR